MPFIITQGMPDQLITQASLPFVKQDNQHTLSYNPRKLNSSVPPNTPIILSIITQYGAAPERKGVGNGISLRKYPPTNGIVRHDSHMRKSGMTRPGIDPVSPWWEASRLTAHSPWLLKIRGQLTVGWTPVGIPRPRSRSEGAIRATVTRTPSASSLLHSRRASRDAGAKERLVPDKAVSSCMIITCENPGTRRESNTVCLGEWRALCPLHHYRNLLASHQGDTGSIPGRVIPDFRMWESCRTMPLVGGYFLEDIPFHHSLSFRCCSILTSITLVGCQDLAVKSRPNLYTLKYMIVVKDTSPQLMKASGIYNGDKVCQSSNLESSEVGPAPSILQIEHKQPHLGVTIMDGDCGVRQKIRTDDLNFDVITCWWLQAADEWNCSYVDDCEEVVAIHSDNSAPEQDEGDTTNNTIDNEDSISHETKHSVRNYYGKSSNWAPVHNVCSAVVTPLESRRASSCGYYSSQPVWYALYECLQDIHGDSTPLLSQPFHKLSNGFWPRLTSFPTRPKDVL
ncbi:hypothetical protein PR048_027796 [Dryococelus australis]|uniref:Uncharacterized protein n=1 Tax=Dryococelus australis TaxID=614101 RepID=A0ABQ9GHK1_9NEOP|nr:hypothetical protein PR048_027796 [Dryococelus australis]